ncbi:MAG TPA: alpha/beta fold hydrolase [Streptosporangiales bacterium]
MRTEHVEFFSGAERVRALWRTPDAEGRHPAVVQGPGWLGLKDAKDYERYHRGFTDGGIAVLAIDYRGFGESEGARGVVSPAMQLADLRNAVSYLTTRPDVEAEAIGAYATGGTGGGNVVLLAARDPRVRAVVSQVPVADGRDWLHRMRTEYEWISFLDELEADRRQRVLSGKSRLVDPREQIMVQTPERRSTNFKKDVDAKVTEQVPLSVVDDLLEYRPLDAAKGLRTPLLVVAVEGDATTPTDHALAIYEAAAGPKKLLLQRGTSHYAAYAQYADVVIPEMVAWFHEHLRVPPDVLVRTEGEGS